MRCDRCGVEMVAGSAYCASCGRPVPLIGESQQSMSAAPTLSPNVAAALCYLAGFVTGTLFLVLEPYRQHRFVRFHALQSILLNVAWIVAYVALRMIETLLPWGLREIGTGVSTLMSLVFLVAAVWLMYRAYGNEIYKLPVIGDLADRQV